MRRFAQPLKFECLESRQMLSVHPLAFNPQASFNFSSFYDRSLIESALIGAFRSQSTSLSATLATIEGNDDTGGSAVYSTALRGSVTTTTLTIDARGLYPNDDDVFLTVNGVDTVHVIPDGKGEIHVTFANNPTGSQLQLPAEFPILSAGDEIGLWKNSGTLVRGSVPMSRVSASLSDSSNIDFSGVATYTTKTIDGVQHATFAVSISGAAPNTAINILTEQRVLTTVMTGASGTGSVFLSTDNGTLPTNFPAILAAGEPISVGNASGILANVPNHRFSFVEGGSFCADH